MKTCKTLFLALFLLITTGVQSCKEPVTAEDLGWKIAVQAWTFNKFSFAQAVEKTKALGLNYIEAYSNQPLGEGYDGTTNYNEGPEARKAMKEILEKNGVTLINYGVVSADSMAQWKEIFDFAKEMGIQTLTAEPKPEQMDSLSKMCDAYGINIAIHNHPQPSFYWNPDKVLENIKGQSPRIGACADIGHWVRSGLDPVECLKKLEGHIISIHFKDIEKKDPEAHDVIWGTGVCNIDGVLQELHRQGYQGTFSIEYEYNWENSMPDIEASLKYFNKVVSTLK